MAYFRFDHETPEKLQVLDIAAALKLPRVHVLGALCLVWRWFSEQTVTGQSRDCHGLIDMVAETPGLEHHLERVGWLKRDGQTMSIPDFDRWLGSAHDARRQRAKRNRDLGKAESTPSRDRHVTVTRPSRPQTHTQNQNQNQEDQSTASLRSAGADPAKPGSPPPVNGHQGVLVPAEPKPARKPRKEASGPHAECIRGWDKLWEASHTAPFAWDAKHASAMAACLKKAEGLPESVLERARDMLYDPPDAWTAQNASPALLASRWNELGQRVVPQSKLHRAVKQIATEEVLT